MRKGFRRTACGGFTILEMLVATAVLVLLLTILLSVLDHVSTTLRTISGQSEAFAAGRSAFDVTSKKISQATLNTYWDYYPSVTNAQYYIRKSDLQFVVSTNSPGPGQAVFFQAPAAYSANSNYQSAQGLLNACGYFIQYGNDNSFRPSAITNARWRYRLMQALQPSENLQVFQYADADDSADWVSSLTNSANVIPLADNVIALIVWPRLSSGSDPMGTNLAPAYQYDSQSNAFSNPQPLTANQLPPTVQLTLVLIDEASAARLDTQSATPPVLLQTNLQGKFTNVTQYQNDLNNLTAALASSHINYQILNTSITMRESKWSGTAP